ncbi:MAG: ABC transporter ATP-binding protein [Bacteroidales bacterium]|nr:ABC transporter ATP-binding protein [Bacteroidales bacterium]
MLELQDISKYLEDFQIRDVHLRVSQGDYLVILGRSGAGKTLLLEILAGIRKPDKGTIRLEDHDITHQRIQHRDVGLVFQDHAIFPHLTVASNIGYPLRRMGLRNKQMRQRVRELAHTAGLSHLLDRYPATLSGGEIQRTVLARTLARNPRLLLLDEPLTSLDVQYKRELQSLLRRLNHQGQTIIHVTHDYEEALALASRVAVMDQGRIRQQGTVEEVFRNPSSSFIAEFVGMRNFFRGTVERLTGKDHKTIRLERSDVSFFVPAGTEEGDVVVTLPARNIILSRSKPDSSALNNFPGTIKDLIPTRQGFEAIVDIGIPLAVMITRESQTRLQIEPSAEIWISFKANSLDVKPL